MPQDPLDVPSPLRRGQLREADDSLRSAVWLIGHLCEHLGLPDLGATELFDIGCGTKFTEAILQSSLPIKRYVGVDVDRAIIELLQSGVTDSRFEHLHLDVHNERYNPTGRPLAELDRLPVEDSAFDVVSLFSVFTHLTPEDSSLMLRLARRHLRPTGSLFFTLYLYETTPGGHGLVDNLARRVADLPLDDPPAFVDLEPAEPLKWAVYSRDHAQQLIEGAGWEIVSISDPLPYLQHHVVCRPA
jgi:SAM-dependent methyltransferase